MTTSSIALAREDSLIEDATNYTIKLRVSVRYPLFGEGVGGIARLTQPDGLHPTGEGAEVMANTVLKSLTPLLRK